MAGDKPGQPAYEIFSIEHIFTICVSTSKVQAVFRTKALNLSKCKFLLHALQYTDCPDRRTNGVMHYVTFAQITY